MPDPSNTHQKNKKQAILSFLESLILINYLSAALNALHHDKEDNDPSQQQVAYDPPPRHARVINTRRCI